jgi:nucleoside-diphosphate-sugar epimerase
MTEPTSDLVEFAARLQGEILILGGSGKMGPELIEMLARADQQAGVAPRLLVASRFSGESGSATRASLESLGVRVLQGDLTDPAFQQSLPRVENLIFMVGFKFGSADDPGRAIQMNCVLPAEIAMSFPEARIVVFSSTNPYPLTEAATGGSRESDELRPEGLYGWSVVGRETAFRAVASGHTHLHLCFFRLAYAQHLAYGVLVDLARMIAAGEPVSLAMPYVNLVSQRDANERALRCLELCARPPAILNVCGPVQPVRSLAERLGELLGCDPVFADAEGRLARVSNDERCRELFGPYRDGVDEMLEAAAGWVADGGESWDKPTKFGVANGKY